MVTVHNPDSFSTILADPGMKWVTVDENYTLTAIDAGVTVTGGAGIVITLLTGANIGTAIEVFNKSGNTITINAGGGETVDGVASITLANNKKLSLRKMTATEWEAFSFIKNAMVDLIYPIGVYYTQYPDASSNTDSVEFPVSQRPATLFGGTWAEQWSTESVFFRTRGTDSDTGRTAGLQTDQNKSHTHSIDHDHAPVATTNGGGHTHGIFSDDAFGASGGTRATLTTGGTAQTKYAEAVGDHTHSVNLPAFTGTSGSDGGTETRVKNRRIKIWKRTA